MSLPLLGGDVDAFVLAGGRSSRMGRDKALIQLAGIPLIERALAILRAAGLNAWIAGGGSELSSFARVIGDDPQKARLGPLSGICSALAVTGARYSVFLPVDLPLVPAGLISCLIHHAAITESAVTLASAAGFLQTFPVVIDRAVYCALVESLHSGDRKCLTAFEAGARSVTREFCVLAIELMVQAGQIREPSGLPPSGWFLNVNTPDDLACAERLLTGRARGSQGPAVI